MTVLTVYAARTDELKDKALFEALYHIVPAYRQRKIDRMRFDKDKRLSLGAGLLLKYALSIVGIDDNCIHIGCLLNKKPYIKEYPKFHFNLSHSEECVMCAVSDCETGCDVEKVTDIDLDIAKEFFSVFEWEFIESRKTPLEKRDIFFRLWTLKESYMKATGLGYELPMNAFCIKIENDNIWAECDLIDNRYSFYEFNLFPGYKYAACVQGKQCDYAVKICHFDRKWKYRKGSLINSFYGGASSPMPPEKLRFS